MAIGSIFRIPRIDANGKITIPRTVIDQNGNMINITEEIFPSERTTIEGKVAHIVNISDQLQEGRYTYQILTNAGASVSSSNILRVFLSGMNVTSEVSLADDGKSFSFSADCDPKLFNPTEILIIDFEER